MDEAMTETLEIESYFETVHTSVPRGWQWWQPCRTSMAATGWWTSCL